MALESIEISSNTPSVELQIPPGGVGSVLEIVSEQDSKMFFNLVQSSGTPVERSFIFIA